VFLEDPAISYAGVLAMFVAVAVLSWLMVFAIRRMAERHQVLDIPNERSLHSRPVPRGGGLAIVAICLAGWFCLSGFPAGEDWLGVVSYGFGATLIAVVSWIDDVRSLPRVSRFAAQSLAAMLLILGYGAWSTVSLPLVGNLPLGWLGLPVVFLWIVGLTNAYNFMDGIDGIAGCQALTAGLGWLVLGQVTGQENVAFLGLLAAAGSAGFLVHNWSPAKIFMGDVGSAFLGYTFAFLTLKAGRENPRLCLAGVFFVWPFVFDSSFTFLRRLLKREPVFTAHRTHLYQRLVVAGWSHAATTLLYTGLDLIGLLLALLFVAYPDKTDWLIVVGLPALACGLWILVVRQERKHRPPDIRMSLEA